MTHSGRQRVNCRLCTAMKWFVCDRCVPLSQDRVYSTPWHRLLPDPSLRSVDADCDPVVGVVLDQRRRQSGASVDRPAHRVDDDHDEQRCAGVSAASVLHQSNRRLDDRLSRVRFHVSDRVRYRQRAGSTHDATEQASSRPAQSSRPGGQRHRLRRANHDHRCRRNDHQRRRCTVGQ